MINRSVRASPRWRSVVFLDEIWLPTQQEDYGNLVLSRRSQTELWVVNLFPLQLLSALKRISLLCVQSAPKILKPER